MCRIDDGGDESLDLVLEVKGIKDETDKAKAQTTRELWVPGVNALGGFGTLGLRRIPRLGRDGRGFRHAGRSTAQESCRLMARSPRSSNGKPSKQVDALKHNEATRRNIPTAEMESFFRRDEDAAPRPPKHYPRARPLAEGETRTAEEPSQPELIWNGARITITDEQMKELAETGTLTLSDAQLVWRGKDRQDWSDLVVNVPPLYIQEKIHPKAIIDDLKRRTAEKREAETDAPDLFADFNGHRRPSSAPSSTSTTSTGRTA